MQNQTPLQAMSAWFETQPKEVQNQAGFLIYTGIAELIGDKEFRFDKDPGEAFLAWLKDTPSGSLVALSKTLLARHHIEFTMINGFCTQESWDRARANNEAALEAARTEERFASIGETAQQMLDDIPRRQAVYMKAAQEWKESIAPVVSDEAIRRWHDATLFANTRKAG
ncbi:hypothetical protein [Paraburkholderia kirstenboschensis]|uniref:Uncharacterized protein n=1 Tax=Paraburkholderia kirstenboschensis TaxID=1245436 RepID=A0ABZ0EP68_9BURK|nr:hypothetical protein [Paraburkholderia kirstenboschensis]WOD18978.1 hypothetical protein RW095_40610 [Paraburkholderia kirstenboschensis]